MTFSITTPAHPHATGVAVYPALFRVDFVFFKSKVHGPLSVVVVVICRGVLPGRKVYRFGFFERLYGHHIGLMYFGLGNRVVVACGLQGRLWVTG